LFTLSGHPQGHCRGIDPTTTALQRHRAIVAVVVVFVVVVVDYCLTIITTQFRHFPIFHVRYVVRLGSDYWSRIAHGKCVYRSSPSSSSSPPPKQQQQQQWWVVVGNAASAAGVPVVLWWYRRRHRLFAKTMIAVARRYFVLLTGFHRFPARFVPRQ
jgi:hypothetical protein